MLVGLTGKICKEVTSRYRVPMKGSYLLGSKGLACSLPPPQTPGMLVIRHCLGRTLNNLEERTSGFLQVNVPQ